MIPVSTTFVTVLRAPEQTDGYPDTEPVYVPVALHVRAAFEIMPRRTLQEVRDRSVAMARFMTDPVDIRPFDYLYDELTGKRWRVEWAELRPQWTRMAHVAGQVIDVQTEVQMMVPVQVWSASASGESRSAGEAAGG